MNILIILGHPDNKSFNHAIADTYRYRLIENGHSVVFHDLYTVPEDYLKSKIERLL